MNDVVEARRIAKGLPKGAAKACLSMTTEWQFCGKNTFNANGAHSLYWNGPKVGALCDVENQKDGKWSRYAYRLTPLGLAVRAALNFNSDVP